MIQKFVIKLIPVCSLGMTLMKTVLHIMKMLSISENMGRLNLDIFKYPSQKR